MVVVRRDNNSLLCIEIGRVETWNELTTFLEGIQKDYEGKGYTTCWDNERLKASLIAWKDRESLFFCVYTKRVPRTRREFTW